MNLDEAMNELLYNSCSNPEYGVTGFNEYRIDLCCVSYVVTAKHLGNKVYQIKSMERVE